MSDTAQDIARRIIATLKGNSDVASHARIRIDGTVYRPRDFYGVDLAAVYGLNTARFITGWLTHLERSPVCVVIRDDEYPLERDCEAWGHDGQPAMIIRIVRGDEYS